MEVINMSKLFKSGTTTSPRLSFKGYSLKKALYRNKDAVKAIIALITGANFLGGFDWNKFLLSLAAGVIALASKLLVDAIDYWFGEIEL